MTLQECYEQMGGDFAGVKRRLPREALIQRLLLKIPQDTNYGLLRTSLAEKNWEEAFRAAHSLKGVALNLGLTPLAQSASEMSELVRAGEPKEDPAPLMARLSEDYDKIIGAIALLNT